MNSNNLTLTSHLISGDIVLLHNDVPYKQVLYPGARSLQYLPQAHQARALYKCLHTHFMQIPRSGWSQVPVPGGLYQGLQPAQQCHGGGLEIKHQLL